MVKNAGPRLRDTLSFASSGHGDKLGPIKVATYCHMYRDEPKETTQFGSVSCSEIQNLPFSYRELIMPPSVMSLVSHFGWLANEERGQRSK